MKTKLKKSQLSTTMLFAILFVVLLIVMIIILISQKDKMFSIIEVFKNIF